MKKQLSPQQIYRLRCVKQRSIFASDVNRSNERRTYASLFKLGLIEWDTIRGRVLTTALGDQALQLEAQRRAMQKLGLKDPPGTLRIQDVGDMRVITMVGEHNP